MSELKKVRVVDEVGKLVAVFEDRQIVGQEMLDAIERAGWRFENATAVALDESGWGQEMRDAGPVDEAADLAAAGLPHPSNESAAEISRPAIAGAIAGGTRGPLLTPGDHANAKRPADLVLPATVPGKILRVACRFCSSQAEGTLQDLAAAECPEITCPYRLIGSGICVVGEKPEDVGLTLRDLVKRTAPEREDYDEAGSITAAREQMQKDVGHVLALIEPRYQDLDDYARDVFDFAKAKHQYRRAADLTLIHFGLLQLIEEDCNPTPDGSDELRQPLTVYGRRDQTKEAPKPGERWPADTWRTWEDLMPSERQAIVERKIAVDHAQKLWSWRVSDGAWFWTTPAWRNEMGDVQPVAPPEGLIPAGATADDVGEQIETPGGGSFTTERFDAKPGMLGYPPDWPKCAAGCGRPVLDGHLTCGRSVCDEAQARERARGL